jgi:hypothetical protein
MTLPEINSESDDGADEGTKLEYGPKYTKGFAFVLFEGVTHHDATLGGPKQSGGYTKDCTGKNQEPAGTLGLMTWGRTVRGNRLITR